MKRPFAVVLAAVVLLSGCGGTAGDAPAGLYFEASGVAPDTVLLTVDGYAVPAARYFYWLTADCDYLADQFDGAPDWDADAGGQSAGEYVKEQALSTTVFYAVMEMEAERQGCVLTPEDLAAIDEDWAAQVSAHGGEASYLATLAALGLDQSGAQLFTADYYLYEQLRALPPSADNPLSPADGEVARYAAEADLFTADVLRFPAAAGAEEAVAALKTDPSLSPDDLTQNGGSYSSVTAAHGDGTLSAGEEDVLLQLTQGAWSQPMDLGEGACLLRPVALDGNAAEEAWFDTKLQEMAQNAAVELSKEYESFTAASFYGGLSAARQANRPASDSPAP